MIITAIRCGAQPLVSDSISNIVSGVYKDVVEYNCLSGLWITRGVFHTTATCAIDRSMRWKTDRDAPQCEGAEIKNILTKTIQFNLYIYTAFNQRSIQN